MAPGTGFSTGQDTSLTSFSVSGVPIAIGRAATTTGFMRLDSLRRQLAHRAIHTEAREAGGDDRDQEHDEVTSAAVHVISFNP